MEVIGLLDRYEGITLPSAVLRRYPELQHDRDAVRLFTPDELQDLAMRLHNAAQLPLPAAPRPSYSSILGEHNRKDWERFRPLKYTRSVEQRSRALMSLPAAERTRIEQWLQRRQGTRKSGAFAVRVQQVAAKIGEFDPELGPYVRFVLQRHAAGEPVPAWQRRDIAKLWGKMYGQAEGKEAFPSPPPPPAPAPAPARVLPPAVHARVPAAAAHVPPAAPAPAPCRMERPSPPFEHMASSCYFHTAMLVLYEVSRFVGGVLRAVQGRQVSQFVGHVLRLLCAMGEPSAATAAPLRPERTYALFQAHLGAGQQDVHEALQHALNQLEEASGSSISAVVQWRTFQSDVPDERGIAYRDHRGRRRYLSAGQLRQYAAAWTGDIGDLRVQADGAVRAAAEGLPLERYTRAPEDAKAVRAGHRSYQRAESMFIRLEVPSAATGPVSTTEMMRAWEAGSADHFSATGRPDQPFHFYRLQDRPYAFIRDYVLVMVNVFTGARGRKRARRWRYGLEPFEFGYPFANRDSKDPSGLRRKERVELVGVVEHIGATIRNGHYVAHMKKGGRWYFYDDMRAARRPEDRVLRRGDPYILVYRRL